MLRRNSEITWKNIPLSNTLSTFVKKIEAWNYLKYLFRGYTVLPGLYIEVHGTNTDDARS
jgi:hypothetical protein